jgi:tRNA uracil 4-sulfurtransferase
MFDYVVIHYDEIGLKGKNRSYFERILIENIKNKVGSEGSSLKRETGLISMKVNSDVSEILNKVPGIAYFSPAKKCEKDLETMKKESLKILESLDFESFRVESERRDKTFEIKSPELNREIGSFLFETLDKKVSLKNPDVRLVVEITDKGVYLSVKKIEGVGGLPTQSKNKVICLLSGGFDSPVASYLMMKRGCEVIFVHYQNKNQDVCSVEDKITQLTKQLSKFQVKTKLYIVPFDELQKEIITKVEAKSRMLVYRRFMMHIAAAFAQEHKAYFLVVGDSLSQVASQTLDNLKATYDGAEMNILAPLIGMNKREIIDISKKIGTYDISSLPYGDCCSYFLPKHPELKASASMLDKFELEFDIKKLVEGAVKKSRLLSYPK